jgi:predicted nucleotidyltransferase
MVNAVRKAEEIKIGYGDFNYFPVKLVSFRCEVTDDTETMFRPTIYPIKDYEPLNQTSKLTEDEMPEAVVSMIGCYRNVARKGDRLEVSGTLEKVEHNANGKDHHQVVVGTGKREDEYVWPV